MSALQGLSHDQLLIQLRDLIQRDHALEAELIAHLAEVDARRLYLEQACPWTLALNTWRPIENAEAHRLPMAQLPNRQASPGVQLDSNPVK